VFVDSHCHLNYLEEPLAALERARSAGVKEALCIGVERTSIEQVLELAAAEPGVWASVGEHPGSCSGDAGWVEALLERPCVVAVGEMGLDYHYEQDAQQRAQQRHTFTQQLEIAAQVQLPVIIHTRAAEADTLALLADFPRVLGVLHCFTESWQMAETALEMGYYVSISGIVTFRNADNVREVAQRVPQERLLIETDAPWLAPVPHRGRKNEPAFVTDTAAYLAQLRGVDVDELAQTTRDNFFRLFSRAERLFI
jgi:TatD DNase family protein